MSFRIKIAVTFFCSWAALATAQPVSDEMIATAKQLRDETMVGSRAWNIVESLTTEVGPRLAGSEAEARAREWAVEKLSSYGFENVRVETFAMDGWERGTEVAEIVVPFPQKLAITSQLSQPQAPRLNWMPTSGKSIISLQSVLFPFFILQRSGM